MKFSICFIIAVVIGAGCASGDSRRSGTGGDTADTDPDGGGGGDAATDADTDADSDAGPDADTDADADTDSDAGPDADTDADSDADSDAGPDADTDADTDTDSDSDTDTSGKTAQIAWRESCPAWCEDLEQHKILYGPASSTAPDDGSWTALVTDTAMIADSWTDKGPFDVTIPAGGLRLSFHYLGTNADSWCVDDVCVTETTPCDLLEESFSAGLPGTWTVHAGAEDNGSNTWYADSVFVRIDNDAYRLDKYLVSPSF